MKNLMNVVKKVMVVGALSLSLTSQVYANDDCDGIGDAVGAMVNARYQGVKKETMLAALKMQHGHDGSYPTWKMFVDMVYKKPYKSGSQAQAQQRRESRGEAINLCESVLGG